MDTLAETKEVALDKCTIDAAGRFLFKDMPLSSGAYSGVLGMLYLCIAEQAEIDLIVKQHNKETIEVMCLMPCVHRAMAGKRV